jgi:hypothetical protein
VAESRTTAQEVQAEILDAVRKGQEAVADAIRQWAGRIQSIAPSVPVRTLPYADMLPKPEEMVASACHVAERVLAAQRAFAERLLQATRPPTSGTNGTAPPDAGTAAK